MAARVANSITPPGREKAFFSFIVSSFEYNIVMISE
jgi:hypothetical protein